MGGVPESAELKVAKHRTIAATTKDARVVMDSPTRLGSDWAEPGNDSTAFGVNGHVESAWRKRSNKKRPLSVEGVFLQ